MNQEQLKNELISLLETEHYCWNILHEEQFVGTIRLDENRHLSFQIRPEYQQKHYGSNAVYVLTPYLHQNGVDQIGAVIPNDNEMAKHIVEHNGYELIAKNETEMIYQHHISHTKKDDSYQPDHRLVLYLAGGCFWGMERVFKALDGVEETVVGYANGNVPDPTYEMVCRTSTGYKETVRVTYNPEIITTETVLKAYFMCIDPTVMNQQAHDIGEQYQTGIYYRNPALKEEIQKFIDQEKTKHEKFCVEFKPLENFYEAEEYHQHYLEKNPDGYCHITLVDINRVKQLNKKA